ncbi:Ldh family oxidoreductase [Roseibium algae]|uniref:Ldh family oxidoreductase n=1 Tax=Roseibium algae TaxID=3123038 RepID=A0ABU8TPP4_9HYPH
MSSVTISLSQAYDLIFTALTVNGASAENAAFVAKALLQAESSGQPGHGLSRVPSYVAQVRSGKVDGLVTPTLEKVTSSLVRVDASFGFAYPAIDLALRTLPDMADKQGIAMAAIRRSHHFGQGGAHCEALAEKGYVSFVFGNAHKAIAPWGGSKPMFGTNPIAFAAPVPGKPPLVIDLAMSRVARGKVMAAEKAGTSIPEGWALDKDGKSTTNPTDAIAGTMLPIGEAKGAALAMMIEVMSAAIVGAAFGFESSSLFTGEGDAPNLGQVILVLNPNMTSAGAFGERMVTLVEAVEVEEGARLPGSRRLASREKAEREGVSIPTPILREVCQLAGKEMPI